MLYKIYYNGDYQDYLIIEAETIEEVRKKVKEELAIRGWKEEDCWSENLTERYE